MSSSYRASLEKMLAGISVTGGIVLDIGGSQKSLESRLKDFRPHEYYIADLASPHEEQNKPDFEIDLNEPFRLTLNDKKFKADIIFCLEVFEYIYNPVQAFRNISDHLFIGGLAWVSFPFIYPTHNPIEQDYLRYTEFAIRKFAELSDLEIEFIFKRRPETNLLTQFYSAERMKASRDYDHAVTGWLVQLKRKEV